MASIARSTAKLVAERWPRVLLNAFDANAEARGFLRGGWKSRVREFHGLLDEAGASRFIEARDHGSELSAEKWARNLNRWLNGTRVPEPQMVRATLSALGADWLYGLGASGYQQHALCLIHGLWKNGARTTAVTEARAIFVVSLDESFVAQRAQRALSRASAIGTPHQDRLDKAVKTAWPSCKGEIPPRPIAPSDLGASVDLYSAWLLLEATRTSRAPDTSFRLVQSAVTHNVRRWIDEQRAFSSVPTLTATADPSTLSTHRRKST